MDLKKYSLPDLLKAKEHLSKVEKRAIKDRSEMPGSGWEPVFDLLERDQAALDAEVAEREAGGAA